MNGDEPRRQDRHGRELVLEALGRSNDFPWLDAAWDRLSRAAQEAAERGEFAVVAKVWDAAHFWLEASARGEDLERLARLVLGLAPSLPREATEAHLVLSDWYEASGQRSAAFEHVDQAVHLATTIGDTRLVAVALATRGSTELLQTTERTAAIRDLLEARRRARTSGDYAAGALACYGLANLRKGRSRLTLLCAALTLARQVEPPTLESRRLTSWALHALGTFAFDTGDLDTAEQRTLEALELKRNLADRLPTANSLLQLADISYARNDISTTGALATEAVDLVTGTPFLWQQALGHHFLGRVDEAQGRYESAESEYREALSLLDRFDPHHSVAAVVLEDIGDTKRARNDVLGALSAYGAALRARPADRVAAKLASALERALEHDIETPQLAAIVGEAVDIVRERLADPELLSRLLLLAGVIADRPETKVLHHSEAWNALSGRGSDMWLQRSLAGWLLRDTLRAWERALRDDVARQLLTARSEIKRARPAEKVAAATMLAGVGEIGDATTLLKEAVHELDATEAPHDTRSVAVAFVAVARHWEAARRYSKALEAYQSALRRLGVSDGPMRGTVLHDIGDVLAAQGKLSDAAASYGEAVATRSIRTDRSLRHSYEALARVLRRMGRDSEASEALRSAIAVAAETDDPVALRRLRNQLRRLRRSTSRHAVGG